MVVYHLQEILEYMWLMGIGFFLLIQTILF